MGAIYKVNLPDPPLAVSAVSRSDLKIYPNPSKGIFFSNVNSGFFELYDFSGRIVKAEK